MKDPSFIKMTKSFLGNVVKIVDLVLKNACLTFAFMKKFI